MASNYFELYSDFTDQIKQYTEKLDVTEKSFMRMFSRGMQKFQRDTKLVSVKRTINRNPTFGLLYVPSDLLEIIEIKDVNNFTLLLQDMDQYNRYVEKYTDGFTRTPDDYSIRLKPEYRTENSRVITIDYNTPRAFKIFPSIDTDETVVDALIYLWYYPDLQAFSVNSAQWATWFTDEDAFWDNFNTFGLTPLLAPYEDAILDYAIAKYLQGNVVANYKIFEARYKEEVQNAIINKPVLMRERGRDYFCAPDI
jgi:hypothetical protein